MLMAVCLNDGGDDVPDDASGMRRCDAGMSGKLRSGCKGEDERLSNRLSFVRDGTGDGLLGLEGRVENSTTDLPLSSDMDLGTTGMVSILMEMVAAGQSGAEVINVKGGPRLTDCERLSRLTLMDDAGDPRQKGDVERNGVWNPFSAILSPSSSSGI
jgi:hypothetical protein